MTNEIETSPHRPSAKLDKEPPRLDIEQSEGGALNIETPGQWGRIFAATKNITALEGILAGVTRLGSEGKRTDAQASNFVLGFVDAMEPRDPAEVLLLTQMAATHQAVMMLATHLNHTTTIQQKDCAEKALNKTARTFAAQMDTLKRYRSKGKQVVRVERVTVEQGGQAIVGNVRGRGRG